MKSLFSTIEFADYPRAAIRAHLLGLGGNIPPACVDEIVDIACFAADSARRQMMAVLDRSSDPRVATTAIGLAVSLAISDMERLQVGLAAFAKSAGLQTYSGKVEVTNG